MINYRNSNMSSNFVNLLIVVNLLKLFKITTSSSFQKIPSSAFSPKKILNIYWLLTENLLQRLYFSKVNPILLSEFN